MTRSRYPVVPRTIALLRGLRLVDESGEALGIADGEIGENLAVHFDSGLAEPVDKSAVGEAEFTGRGVDALNPQRPEIALLGAAVAVTILLGLLDGLDGDAENVLAAAEIARRFLDDF